MAELAHWDTFCVVVGGAAGALIGLQFVVLTLIAERPPVGAALAGAAFASPTIVHFSAVLLVVVMMRMPWHAPTTVAALWGLVGFAGAVYVLIVLRRMRVQKAYEPDLEDWLFHGAAPFAGYATIAVSALVLPSHEGEALFGVAAGTLVLLFTAIHNAWDAVVYHVLVARAGAAHPSGRSRE
ncbi:MAG TPA: hypothetical protein VEG27_01125 [Usitatibacter sp.]|nr:hypothetical protein [Usitatibacter sp.]